MAITSFYTNKQSSKVLGNIKKSVGALGNTASRTIRQEKWLKGASEQYDFPSWNGFGMIQCSELITAICAGKYPKKTVDNTFYGIVVTQYKVAIKSVKIKDIALANEYFTKKYSENFMKVFADLQQAKDYAIELQAVLEEYKLKDDSEEFVDYINNVPPIPTRDDLEKMDIAELINICTLQEIDIKRCSRRSTIIDRILKALH